MRKLATKISAVGLSFITMVSLAAPVASAQSTADLQAQIAALLAQINALQSQLSGTSVPAAGSYTFSNNLTVGSRGADVTALQQILISGGFLTAVSAPTGYFGPATKAALAAWQSNKGISPAVGYFGPITRAAMSSVSGPVIPGVIPSGFGLSLAGDNPMSASVPKGATGVVFLKFNVSGTGTLNTLTFKRVGIGSTNDFGSAGLYLYEGATRLTSGKSINSTTHEVTFLNLGLAVSGMKTLSLVADISGSATASNRSHFELVSAAGTPTPTGALMGNDMVIGGQSVGGVVAASSSSPTAPKVGQLGAKIAEFKLTASATEDIYIQRLAMTEGESIANNNLSNFVLKQGGNTIATAASVGAKDLINFTFTAPFLLEKGQERTFQVYADIAGAARSGDKIALYFDSASDIYAVGRTYGFPVLPSISTYNSVTSAQTLTITGGDLTITFNGPVAGDIALRGQDVVLYDFTIASNNNIEIRNLRTTVTASGAIDKYNDFKVWDADANAVITSAFDVASASSTDKVFTDVININAGTSKHFKITADVDSTNSADGTVKVTLVAFTASDIRNLDNNTYVATSVIVPNTNVVGNEMTVKTRSLDVQLSATPVSQTYVRGTTAVPLAGYSFRAISGDARIDSIRVTGVASSGTLTSGEVQSLALYDGATMISTAKSLDSSALTATFDNLNYTIASGATKVFTLKGNISSDATIGDVFYFDIASITSSDITAYDGDGNSISLTGIAANATGAVTASIADVGDVTVVKAADDVESEAGIVVANGERVLAKFRFTATNENMTLNKVKFLVNTAASLTATTTAVADEAPIISLYDGATKVGGPYYVEASGDNAGQVVVEGLGWAIPKDSSKTLTVKGTLNSISSGADSGSSVVVNVKSATASGQGFEASGATAKDNTITGASGNVKVVYKTKPTITVASAGGTLTAGSVPVIRFTVAADSAEQVSWKKVQLYVGMTAATMSKPDWAANTPSATGNVKVKDLSSGTNLSIGTVYSGATTAAVTTSTIAGGASGYVTLILENEEQIAAGGSKSYEVSLTFADVSSTAGAASAVVKLHRGEATLVSATTYGNAETATEDGAPSFIWSDNSATGHGLTTADWANSYYVKTLPSDSFTTKN
jgi:peptidoglycan hydrolase-like protein with peptidoglycan-binding domain